MAAKWRDIGKNQRVAVKATRPGVWRAEGGGWWVRGRVTDPRTGRKREVSRFLKKANAKDAYEWLHNRLEEIRTGNEETHVERTRFGEFVASLFARKIEAREIRSAAGRRKWASVLERHLIPAFGDLYIDIIGTKDLLAWRRELASRIHRGELAPTTANGWIAVMKVCTKAIAIELELDRDPGALLQPLPLTGHRTYTAEEPNALKPADVPRFLEAMARIYPQFHAFCMLGFLTGLRPSTLRPLRRSGSSADVLWNESSLLVRRSQTYGDEVMESTKTGRDQRIALPEIMMAVLRAHVDELPEGPMRQSELLFPGRTGSYRSRSCLDRPFRAVCREIALPYRVTPRGMRRTYQDLARAAAVSDLVTRSISGHATEEMHFHYSTVSEQEQREALARVADLCTKPSKK